MRCNNLNGHFRDVHTELATYFRIRMAVGTIELTTLCEYHDIFGVFVATVTLGGRVEDEASIQAT